MNLSVVMKHVKVSNAPLIMLPSQAWRAFSEVTKTHVVTPHVQILHVLLVILRSQARRALLVMEVTEILVVTQVVRASVAPAVTLASQA
jgi:hypothetical protein